MDNLTLTRLDLKFIPDRLNLWLCFGRVVREQFCSRTGRTVYLAPNSVAGVVLWQRNRLGTVAQKLYVWRTRGTTRGDRIEELSSDAERLLQVAGHAKIVRALALVDAIRDQDIEPEDAASDYWRRLHRRFATSAEPHLYTRDEHRVYLSRVGRQP